MRAAWEKIPERVDRWFEIIKINLDTVLRVLYIGLTVGTKEFRG